MLFKATRYYMNLYVAVYCCLVAYMAYYGIQFPKSSFDYFQDEYLGDI